MVRVPYQYSVNCSTTNVMQVAYTKTIFCLWLGLTLADAASAYWPGYHRPPVGPVELLVGPVVFLHTPALYCNL